MAMKIANILYSDLMSVIYPTHTFFNTPYLFYNIKITENFYLRVEVTCEEEKQANITSLGQMWLIASTEDADVKKMEITLSDDIEEAKKQQRMFWSYCTMLRQ